VAIELFVGQKSNGATFLSLFSTSLLLALNQMRVQNITNSISRPVKLALGQVAERWINKCTDLWKFSEVQISLFVPTNFRVSKICKNPALPWLPFLFTKT
jgi:hypothetical protein